VNYAESKVSKSRLIALVFSNGLRYDASAAGVP
jgi:hypothetical protein